MRHPISAVSPRLRYIRAWFAVSEQHALICILERELRACGSTSPRFDFLPLTQAMFADARGLELRFLVATSEAAANVVLGGSWTQP